MESKGIKVSGYSDSIVNIYSETAIKEAKTLISEVEGLIMNKNTTIDEIGNAWVNSIFGSTKTINFLLLK